MKLIKMTADGCLLILISHNTNLSMRSIMNRTIAKYMMNRPCFWYNGVSFLKNTNTAPYTRPIIGEITAMIYPIIGIAIVPSFSIFSPLSVNIDSYSCGGYVDAVSAHSDQSILDIQVQNAVSSFCLNLVCQVD